jgi:hypothetical protein
MSPVQISAPRDCHLWLEVLNKDMVLNAFDVVKDYKNDHQLQRGIRKCKTCGQLYFSERFDDLNPWTWDEDKYYAFIPVDDIDSADALNQMARDQIVELIGIRLELKPDDGVPYWRNAKQPSPTKNYDSLIDFVNGLDEERQYTLALLLVEKALPLWEEHASKNALEYFDSVVGMHHVINKDIVARALDTVKKELAKRNSQLNELAALKKEFMEPLVALQDSDWELPYPVQHTLYAASNLVKKITGESITPFDEPLIYVVINQAFDALISANVFSIPQANVFLRDFSASSIDRKIIINPRGSDPRMQ